MTSLTQVEAIFHAASGKNSPGERVAYLDEACQGDPDLRQQVERLLTAQLQLGSFLDPPADDLYATVEASQLSDAPGTMIGPYKLLQQIGEGGMGTVYMAEQTEPVRRMVALKLIKEGMDSRQIIARFETERQALALMDHPNIAKVFDAGTIGPVASGQWPVVKEPNQSQLGTNHSPLATTGRPYFVMELVKGVPITKYCDEHHLTPRQRLELFIPVCQAVQHAHQKGIIHRDLKPSNVLVAQYDGKPVPKVIDFGVAKAAGPKLTDMTLFTELGAVVGTFEYMSPEQAELNQLDVDTRSDIYSLGVLLYELLTGTTPLERKRIKQVALLEVLRLIREEESPKLSTRLSSTEALPSIAANRGSEPKKLTGLMRGELDWIVMKTLDKDRNRRYETANGLAMDVQRYLADEAVQACPPSVTYRIRKFARRNRAAFWTTGVVTLALIIGTVVSAWQAVRATQQSIRAAEAEGLAQERSETAIANYNEAEEQRQAAKTQEALANEQRKNAVANEKTAKEQELLARRRFYAGQMNLALQAWEAGQPARVLELLESQRPRFDEEDLRGFEWYYLWRLCLARHRFSLPTQNVDNAEALAYSPDGKSIASGYGGTVKIWDAATGRELRQFGSHQSCVWCVAYAPDGKTLASREGGGPVKIWDLATGKERATIASNTFGFLAFTADSKTLVLGGDCVKVWNLTLGREEAVLRGKAGEKFDKVAVAPDGKTVAAGSNQGQVRTWTRDGMAWRDGILISELGWMTPVAISPDGKVLAAGRGPFRLYELATGKERIAPLGHIGTVNSIAFTGDGKTLMSAGQDRTVRVWDAVTGQQKICLAHPGPVYGVAPSPDGKMLAAMTSDAIRVWEVSPMEEQTVLRHTGDVASVAFSPDGKSLVSLGSSLRKSWDTASGQEISTLPAANNWRTCLAFSPDGKMLVTSGLPYGGIELWNAMGKREAVLQGPTADVSDLAMALDGNTLACISQDGSIIVWDLGTHQPRQKIQMGGSLSAVAFSPDGKTLAVGAQFGIVKLLDADTGKERTILQIFELAATYTRSVIFSPNGKLLATCDDQGLVRLWDIATGRLHASLRGHTDVVWSLDFSPDGKTLASASEDRTVRLWDVATGQERITLKGHQGGITSVVFAPDGKTLATGSHDGTVRLWRAATGADAKARQKELDPNVPETPAAHNERGDRLWQSDRIDEAEKAYREALARLEELSAALPNDPGYPQEMVRSLLSLSFLVAQRDHSQEAKKADQKAQDLYQSLSPEHRDVVIFRYLERVRKLNTSGGIGGIQAERTCSQAVEIAPTNHRTWANRATCYQRLGQYQKAVADWSRSLELMPEYPFAWFGRGYAYGMMSQHHEALSDYTKAIELDPKEALAWNNRGVCYENFDQQDKAITDFSKAIDLRPADALFWNNRGRIYTRLSLWDKAIADYTKVIELSPDKAGAWHQRAALQAQIGQWEKAEADYAKALELVPKSAESQNNVAWLLATCPEPKFRDAKRAVELAKKAVELAPQEGNNWNTLGVALYRAGDWKAALAALEKSTDLLKGNQVSFNAFFLAMAHWQLGEKEEARKWYDQAVQWMEKNAPKNEELVRFRAEAEKLLGLIEKK
jgi:eukaryotic-like serine/threonine-protein kinase